MTNPSRYGSLRLAMTLLALVLVLGVAGCRHAAKDTPVSAAAREESSVRPGINDAYLDPDLDVTQWIERFEREGREVYVNRERIVDTLGIRTGMDVADIGSGTGIFIPLLARKTGSEGMVYAVDIVPEFLKLIEKRSEEQELNNVLTVLCTERSVELPEHSIDLAFICDVYHHFEYPFSSLTSIHRALRPGGALVVIDFKRVPGESSDWILEHVRAGEDVVRREIQSTGFRFETEHAFLQDNYMLVFRKDRSSAN